MRTAHAPYIRIAEFARHPYTKDKGRMVYASTHAPWIRSAGSAVAPASQIRSARREHHVQTVYKERMVCASTHAQWIRCIGFAHRARIVDRERRTCGPFAHSG
jgi:hypothetical protein